jgi:hypothetical protein
MKRKLILMVQVFLASMMTVINAQSFDAEKTYTIECNNQAGKYMQDNDDGFIVPKGFNDNSYWYLIATGNEGCYYVKNATTNRYMQKTSEYQVSVKTGDDPVEILIKNDPAKGTNVYALASTDQDLSFSGDKTYGANYTEAYVQGFKANLGANPNSFWKIVEQAIPGSEPETGHLLSGDKIYTIVCKPDFNTFMQDNGTGGLLLGAESAGTLWCFEPTENANCYYVKNVKTGNYIQACPDSDQPATMGTDPVEYYIKGDAVGGQAGENFYRMTSTDRSPHDFSAGTIGLNRAGDNTKVQGFASVTAANQWSVWCIREVEMVQQASLSSPFTGSEVQEGTVYLYNVESGKWLQNNNRLNPELTTQYWTTRAELGDWGLDLNLTALGDGSYQIDPNFINNHSINDFNLYMDTNQPITSWKFIPKNMAGITNAYSIVAEKATLGSDVNGYLRGADLGATTWQVVTLDERIQYAQQNATAENPIDMTFLVPNPDLSNNNERVAWGVTRDGGSEGWNDNARYNRNFYASGFNSLDVSQTEIAVPNGTYKVSFSLLYSPTALGDINIDDYNAYKTNGDETVYVVGYANGETIKARSIYSVEGTSGVTNQHQKQVGDYFFPGGPNQVNGTMAIGNYQTEPLTVTVTDGKLSLGVKSIEGCPTTAYIGFNGIKLYCVGAAEESPITVSVTDALYATYVAPCDVDFTGSEVSAYAAQVNDTYVHLEPVTTVPEGTAVVVKAAEAGTYTINSATSASPVAGNDLIAATEGVNADGTQYVLAKVDEVVGFYKVTEGTTIPAGKGYIVISSPVKAFYGFDEDDATGISDLNVDLKFNETIYNLAGQRLLKLQKGINIVKGKKIAIK